MAVRDFDNLRDQAQGNMPDNNGRQISASDVRTVSVDTIDTFLGMSPGEVASLVVPESVLTNVVIDAEFTTLSGEGTVPPNDLVIWGSILESRRLEAGDEYDNRHVLVAPRGEHLIKDLALRYGRGSGLVVRDGATVNLQNVWIHKTFGPGIYIEKGGRVIGDEVLVELCGINPSVPLVYAEEGAEFSFTNSVFRSSDYQVLLKADGVGYAEFCHLWGYPQYEGNVTLRRPTITVPQNVDDQLIVSRGDGTQHDMRSGDALVSVEIGFQPVYPAGAGFGVVSPLGNGWVVPAAGSVATTRNHGCYEYWDIATEADAEAWQLGVAYRVGDVVRRLAGGLRRCTVATGVSTGTDTDDDTGHTWAVFTPSWDSWKRYHHIDLATSTALHSRTNNGHPDGLLLWNAPFPFPGSKPPMFYNGLLYNSPPS